MQDTLASSLSECHTCNDRVAAGQQTAQSTGKAHLRMSRRFRPAEETGQCYKLAYQRAAIGQQGSGAERRPTDHGCLRVPATCG